MNKKKLYQEAFNSVSISNSAVERLYSRLESRKPAKSPVRMLKFIPVLAVILTMGITVTAISLSTRDTVENIYFDRDYTHNLIMDMNPQYDAYLTEEGIEQLENFEPIALDTTDHSGSGNDLKSATLIGVMADKYTMTSLIEVEFNEDIVVPEDNLKRYQGGQSGAVTFMNYFSESDKSESGGYNPYTLIFDRDRGRKRLREAEYQKPLDPYVFSRPKAPEIRINIAPVAEKPNTAIIFIEELRKLEEQGFEKKDKVRYTLNELGVGNRETKEWTILVDGEYIFEITAPKKLISANKAKVNKEFIYDDCKFDIEAVEYSQGYVSIDYTCELLPDYYENHKLKIEEDRTLWGGRYELEFPVPFVRVLNGDGKRIPVGRFDLMGLNGELDGIVAGGEYFPAYDPQTKHNTVIHFWNPQNEDTVKEIIFTDDPMTYGATKLLTIELD